MMQSGFRRYAWAVLFYNLGVVLWGAYVRATGSGAGCGRHWPTCQGEIIPRAPALETVVEFSHRLTSGLALVSVVVLLAWSYRAFAPGDPVRRAALWAMVFILLEALVGAGLVLLGLVAHDQSLGRAWAMSIHLINTFLLLAALTTTAWRATAGGHLDLRGRRTPALLLAIGAVAMLVLGVSGAITALGDTLFPFASLEEGLVADFNPAAHAFIRLRMLHPALALGVAGYLALAAIAIGIQVQDRNVKRASRVVVALFLAQLGAGLLNLLLLAPVWMQLVHLLLADAVWVTLVVLANATLSKRPRPIVLVPSRHEVEVAAG
jgi:heme A synthase